MIDYLAEWRAALAGAQHESALPHGTPKSGYWRFPYQEKPNPAWKFETVATWFDPKTGEHKCWRSKWGNGAKLEKGEIWEMFASEHYAIPYELFKAINAGEPWPEIYTTRLATKDRKAGVIWSEAWAAKKLAEMKAAADPAPAGSTFEGEPFKMPKGQERNPQIVSGPTFDSKTGKETPAEDQAAATFQNPDSPLNDREQIGGNNPPAPDQELAAKIAARGEELSRLIREWGGAPRNQAEADLIGIHANKFKDYENEATDAHRAEKAPHLEASRKVDAKWFAPVRDKAVAYRSRALEIIRAFTKREDDRKAEEARKVNAEARKRAEEQAKIEGTAPAAIEEIAPERTCVTTMRGPAPKTEDWICVDHGAAFAYFVTLPALPIEIRDAIASCGKKVCKATKTPIPGFEWKKI